MLRRAKPLLGTLVEIAFEPATLNAHQANALMAQAFSRIQGISDSLSFHSSNSELTRLNQAWGRWCPMSQDGVRVLTLAKGLGALSQDKFNCTVGGELVALNALPNHFSHEVLPQGCWRDIQIRHQGAKLLRPVLVTLDGIAKGYAVDMAVSLLKRAGITAGWVNAGGDLRVFGAAQLPVSQRSLDGFSQPIILTNTALASSRITSYFDADYPALFIPPNSNKPSDEQPIQSECIISVSAPFAWRADALTKIAAASSMKDSAAIIAGFGGKLVRFESNGK